MRGDPEIQSVGKADRRRTQGNLTMRLSESPEGAAFGENPDAHRQASLGRDDSRQPEDSQPVSLKDRRREETLELDRRHSLKI